jgi:hypothetical protein
MFISCMVYQIQPCYCCFLYVAQCKVWAHDGTCLTSTRWC